MSESAGGTSGLTGADWARYAGLLALASLLFLAIFGTRDGAVPALLAIYLLGGLALLLVARRRRGRERT